MNGRMIGSTKKNKNCYQLADLCRHVLSKQVNEPSFVNYSLSFSVDL